MKEPFNPTEDDIGDYIKRTGARVLDKRTRPKQTIWLIELQGSNLEVAFNEFMSAHFISFAAHLFPLPSSNPELLLFGMLHENGGGSAVYFGISQIRDNMVVYMNSDTAFDLVYEKFFSRLDLIRKLADVMRQDPEDFKRNLGWR